MTTCVPKHSGTGAAADRWLPISLRVDSARGRVQWMNFGSTSFVEPFFGQTVARLRQATPAVPVITTSLQDLLDLGGALPSVQPSGLIFHVSRCGSTVVANALRRLQHVQVIAEAETFNSVLCGRQERTPSTDPLHDPQRILAVLGSVYATGTNREHSRLVIKFSSCCVSSMRLVRQIWPVVPTIMMVRNPVEVLVSNLREPAPWLRRYEGPDMEEYCARRIGELCQAASGCCSGLRVVDYSHLGLKRICEIAEFFGIPFDARASEALSEVLASYSKCRASSRTYRDDRGEKQRAASLAAIQSANKWMERPYRELLELEKW